MRKEYTPLRRFYAIVGFVHLIGYAVIAGWYAYSAPATPIHQIEQYVPYSPPQLQSVPILSTTTKEIEDKSPGIDFVDKSRIEYTLTARVTGYNTTVGQTDSTPCIAADGSNICGRDDTVACPRSIALGTKVMIYAKIFECVDRTALKYDGVFDINCNLDMECPRLVTSTTSVKVIH